MDIYLEVAYIREIYLVVAYIRMIPDICNCLVSFLHWARECFKRILYQMHLLKNYIFILIY